MFAGVDELARALVQTNDAFAQGDLSAARAALDSSRVARARLSDIQRDTQDITAPSDPVGLSLLADLRARAASIPHEDNALRHWLSKNKASGDGPPPDPEQADAFIDAVLPLAWEPALDLILLCGESSRVLAHALAKRGYLRIIAYCPNGRENFPTEAVVVASQSELLTALRAFSAPMPRRLAFVPPLAGELSHEEHQELLETASSALDAAQVERNTVNAFGETWAKQGLANLPKLAALPSVASLQGAFTGLPMVLLAPGPSLAKNAHLVAALKGRALLVTMSHALAAVQRYGIEPDLVLALDAQDLRYHFQSYPAERIPALVLGVTVRPELFHLPAQRIFSFSGNATLESWLYGPLPEDPRLASGGSVSHCCFSLGLRMGCDPIILVGQDLAFTGGRVYANGSCDAGATIRTDAEGRFTIQGYSADYQKLSVVKGAAQSKPARVLTVPGYEGGEVQTSFPFSLFRRWFADTAAQHGGPSRFWNCTEGGARIDNFAQLPLWEAIARLGTDKIDIGAALDRATKEHDPEARRARLSTAATELLRQLDACATRAQRCIRVSNARETNESLRQAEKALLEVLRSAWFLSLLSQREVNAALAQGVQAKSAQASINASRALYRLTVESARQLRPALVHARDALSAKTKASPAPLVVPASGPSEAPQESPSAPAEP
jgi:hypothetical protein